MNRFISLSFACLTCALWVSVPSWAAVAERAADPRAETQAGGSEAAMTDGEVRKVDKAARKLTLKHSPIKNLDMPGMTMVFQVKDAAMLDKLQPGDKVQFSAERAGGAIVVTRIQAVK